jgi:preprotein translocase subunit SecE
VADEKKPNAITRYFRETGGELRKVTWPTRREAVQLTGIVLAVMVVMALYLALADKIGTFLVSLALGS